MDAPRSFPAPGDRRSYLTCQPRDISGELAELLEFQLEQLRGARTRRYRDQLGSLRRVMNVAVVLRLETLGCPDREREPVSVHAISMFGRRFTWLPEDYPIYDEVTVLCDQWIGASEQWRERADSRDVAKGVLERARSFAETTLELVR